MNISQRITPSARRIPSARRTVLFSLAAAVLFCGLLSPAPAQDRTPALKALIVTGQNTSHDWKVSTAALKQMLEDTGLFQVDVAESPAPGAKMNAFSPAFASYKLVVLNYYGDIWPPSTRRAFSAYVKNGGGVVVYHGAAAAFAGWPEYNEIIGLGGFANRNESFGPYVYWKDGGVVRDTRPGIAGYHPRPFVFPVVNRDTTHPITAGLPAKWMHAEDELYCLLRGPAKNLTVLATARSGFENGGTGRDEPVLFTVTYGTGRVFHTVLGHAAGEHPPGLECAGFIVTFRRGAEWAATGQVTQKVPPDFPATNRDIATPADVRLWPGFRPPTIDAVLKDLATFEYSRDEAALYRLREYVLAHNKTEEARACEQELLAALGPTTQPYAVMALCRELRLVGSEKSVPALEKLLLGGETSDAARYALEKIPGAAADAALLGALGTAQGEAKAGLVSSLGDRRSAEAVKPLAALITGQDGALARAAITSLGRIGGAEATSALAEAYSRAAGELKTELAYALVGSTDALVAARDFPAAQALADKILATPPAELPRPVRQSAFRGRLMSLEKAEAARLVLETLAKGPADLREPAIGRVKTLFGQAEIAPVAALLPKLPEPSQVQLVAVLGDYPKDAVLATIVDALKSPSKPVRLAALKALAGFPDPSNVTLLAQLAAQLRGEEQAAARRSLSRMPGKEIDEAILFQALASPQEEVKSELIRAIGERRIAAGKGLLLAAAGSAAPAGAAQAARALRAIAGPADIPGLLDVLLETGDETVESALRTTIGYLAQEIANPEARAASVKSRLVVNTRTTEQPPALDAGKRAVLYLTLGNIGDNSTLPLLRAALGDSEAGVRDAAVQAVSAWPSDAAREDCLGIARAASDLNHKVLALRGYVRMVGLEKYQSPQQALQALKTALDLAPRPDEIKLVLGALPDFPSPEALALAESLVATEGVQAEAQAAVDALKEKLENPN